MKKYFLFIALISICFSFSQNEQIANYYYEKGDFEKAKFNYEQLLTIAPDNLEYFQKVVDCYQQLQQFQVAQEKILKRMKLFNESVLLVEMGYNYKIQKKDLEAENYYQKAITLISKEPIEVFAIADAFEKKAMPKYALKAYFIGAKLLPNYNFNYQLGLLYGQTGDLEKMIVYFLKESFENRPNKASIQYQFLRYMNDEGDSKFSELLKKSLIANAQETNDVFWNEYLSWFYIQQKDYRKAFVQEKAIYRRNPETLSRIVAFSRQTFDGQDQDIAQEVFEFIIKNTTDIGLTIYANCALMKIKIQKSSEKDYEALRLELELLRKKFDTSVATLPLQLVEAHFVAFNLKNTVGAKSILEDALKLPLTNYQNAEVKMELADILLFEEKFNQAILYYSQIQNNLPNDVISHEASLKSAKASYFKADFEWALKQFKTLKSASTQLVANDALEYFLLINDNTVADSTQTALKQFAKGDFLLYKNSDAQAVFETILKDFKGTEIEPITLFRLAKIAEKKAFFDTALEYYNEIITQHSDCIYVDEALFFSAEIYNENLNLPEKAKILYEKIIFEHQDSIYFVEAQKKFRTIRGDPSL